MNEAESPPINGRSHSDQEQDQDSDSSNVARPPKGRSSSSQSSAKSKSPSLSPPSQTRPSTSRRSLARRSSSVNKSVVFDEPVEQLNVYAGKDDLAVFDAMKKLTKPKAPRTAYHLFMSDYSKKYHSDGFSVSSAAGSTSSLSPDESKKTSNGEAKGKAHVRFNDKRVNGYSTEKSAIPKRRESNPSIQANHRDSRVKENGHVNGKNSMTRYRDARHSSSEDETSGENDEQDDEEEESEEEDEHQVNGHDTDEEDDAIGDSDQYGEPVGKRSGSAASPNDSVLSPSKFNIGNFSRECSRRWKSLPDEEKRIYYERAKQDKERYENELADFTDKMAHYSARLAEIMEESAKVKD